MALTLVKITIPAGQSISNGVNLSSGRLVRIRMPPQWRSANLTFQLATTDVPADYRNLYAREGNEVMLNSVEPNSVIGLPGDITHFLQDAWIKIRSGPVAGPVVQPAACEFELVLYRGQVTAQTLPAEMDDGA